MVKLFKHFIILRNIAGKQGWGRINYLVSPTYLLFSIKTFIAPNAEYVEKLESSHSQVLSKKCCLYWGDRPSSNAMSGLYSGTKNEPLSEGQDNFEGPS